MLRIVWLTDVHLNFVEVEDRSAFFASVCQESPDAVLLTGDVAEGPDIVSHLRAMAREISAPIYFVLGNHDFYRDSIVEVRRRMSRLCEETPSLVYLTAEEVVPLTPSIGLIGHDGWADARLGDYEHSLVMMHDNHLIKELIGYNKQQRWDVLKRLGDQAAAHIRRVLPLALGQFPEVILATHVPPLREACWHEGQISDNQWAPHFTCKAIGDAILDIMQSHPDQRLTVYCGHTHGQGRCQPLENVEIFTGGAQYGEPAIVSTFTIE